MFLHSFVVLLDGDDDFIGSVGKFFKVATFWLPATLAMLSPWRRRSVLGEKTSLDKRRRTKLQNVRVL